VQAPLSCNLQHALHGRLRKSDPVLSAELPAKVADLNPAAYWLQAGVTAAGDPFPCFWQTTGGYSVS
jgi:hypothetical protein